MLNASYFRMHFQTCVIKGVRLVPFMRWNNLLRHCILLFPKPSSEKKDYFPTNLAKSFPSKTFVIHSDSIESFPLTSNRLILLVVRDFDHRSQESTRL